MNHTVIRPNQSAASRQIAYFLANNKRLASAVINRTGLRKPSPSEPSLLPEDLSKSRKPPILFLGPYHFTQPIINLRLSSVLPSLLHPLAQDFELHLATPCPPAALAGKFSKLVASQELTHHIMPSGFLLWDEADRFAWLGKLAIGLNAAIVSNCFSAVHGGRDAVGAAAVATCKSIVRIPGDELTARKLQSGLAASENASFVKIDKRRLNEAITNADRIIVMNSSERRRICTEGAIDASIIELHRGVDTERFTPSKSPSIAQSANPIRIGFAGRLSPEKGRALLDDVIERLSGFESVEFKIAGSLPDKQLAKRLHKAPNVTYQGFLKPNQIHKFYQEIDVLFLPSLIEGQSQTMMEALASGVPVLMREGLANVGGNSTKQSVSKSGILTFDSEQNHPADMILKLASNREQLKRMSQLARNYAVSQLDQGIWNTRYRDLFLNVSSERRTG